jgi:hypothetical protein
LLQDFNKVTSIIPVDNFKRIVHPSLQKRRTHTKDPRLTVPRVGYPKHTRRDDTFGKVSPKEKRKSAFWYTIKEKFCEGFDLTAPVFYIVRYRLCVLLYRNGLWLKKQKEGKQAKPNVEFDYAEVEEKIGQHILLSGRHVHPYWKGKMIPEFVSRTAEWLRSKKQPLANEDGNVVTYELMPEYDLALSCLELGP